MSHTEPAVLPAPAPTTTPAPERDPGPARGQHRLTPTRRPPVARLVALAGLGCWVYGVGSLSPERIGDLGLLDAGRGSAFVAVGLAALLFGFLNELRHDGRSWVLALELVGLIVAIHATVPLVFHAPEYAWVYKHVGVASALQQNGRVIDPNDIYQEWPALFAGLASISSLAHINPLSFARWAPLAFELADALLLVGIFRMLTASRRLAWLAVVIYEGLVAWVGQDYLSPQAFAYLLWLGVILIILRWLRHDPSTASDSPAGRVSRLRSRLVSGIDPAPSTTRGMRVLAVALVVALFLVITAAHQLTPYMALTALAALTLLDVVRPRWLVFALAAIAGGYLALHYDLISQQFGGLFSGGTPLAHAGGAKGTPNASVGASLTSRTVFVFMAITWLGAVAAVVRRRRSAGTVVIPAALAFTPFLILFAQSYGGEAIYRVFLFSAPWCALLIAGGLGRLRAGWRWPVTGVAATAMLFAGVQGLYGPVLANAFTPDDVNASVWLYTHLPRRSLVVLPVDNFPGLESSHYADYDFQTMPADPQIGLSWMNEGRPAEVQRWLSGLGHRSAYVVVSRSMDGWARFYGAPKGYATLVRDLPTVLHGTVVYRNHDAAVYRIDLGKGS